jgi:uncharacterized protein (TIGR02996 family)
MLIARLRERFHELSEVKGVLAVLGDQPAEQKRDAVYPAVIELLALALCDVPAAEPRSVVATLHFVHRELLHEPELAARLFAAIGERTVRYQQPEFFLFIAATRDRRGIPLLRGGSTVSGWVDAVVALSAGELLDEVVDALDDEPTRDLAAAVAILGGEGRRADLERAPRGDRDDVRPIGLALLASPGDKARFADRAGTPNQTTARRIYTALAARGPKQRLTALDELTAGITDATIPFGAERLLAFTLALGDKRADVAERAAAALAAYVKTKRPGIRILFHSLFLARAGEVVARGVTDAARTYLEVVRAAIPRAAPLGAAKIVAPPPTRTAAAKARGEEMVEALGTFADASAERRDPALEAVIAAAPDDRAAYLVYADWLQGAGDVRGTWIALQIKSGLAAREASAKLLAEHRAALLGPLAPHAERGGPVELDWFMGFVRRATFRSSAATDALTALLDATCGALVQELVFGDAAGERAVIELLLARRPQTLRRLAFGTAEIAPPELVAAIPRLARDPRARWADALARVAEQRVLEVELDADYLPELEPVGPGIEADAKTALAGLRYELELEKQLGMAAALRAAFTRESVDHFARALGEAWFARGRPDRLRWAFEAMGPLGGDETARWLGSQLARLGSREREAAALGYLAQIGGDVAIEQLTGAAFDLAAHPRTRDAAREVLAGIAERRGLYLDALIARAAPSVGDRAAAIQRAWLESLMVEGRGLPADELAAAVLAHPRRMAAARTLLWAEREGDTVVCLLRLDERGRLVRRGGVPYEPAHPIGLVHPAELVDDELDTVQQVFASVVQAIPQVERPSFGVSASEARATELVRFAKRRVGFDPIATTLRGRGWYVAASDIEDDDGEDRWVGTRAFARHFLRDGVRAVATLGDTRGAIARVTAWSGAGECRFDELHVVTLSELLWDLETAHGRPAGARSRDAAPRVPVPAASAPAAAPAAPAAAAPAAAAAAPAAPAAPTVERAKSGRSRCVVCKELIAKDSQRIGIDRFVETPTFRGRATVWLHPACRDGAPELEGVDLGAALPP